MRLFVSHSSNDREFVAVLVEFLLIALKLPVSDIRCTSLPGHGLPGGANIADQLRHEVESADAFIAVISNSSLDSQFTVFEMGARWGAKKTLVPVLVPGITPEDLMSPLNQLLALASKSLSDMRQLVRDLAESLGAAVESPAVYEVQLEKLVQFRPDISVQGGVPATKAGVPLEPGNVELQFNPIIRDELERLSSAFRASVADTVAELGAEVPSIGV